MFKNKYLKFYNSLPKNIKKGLYLTFPLFFISSILEVLTIFSIDPLASKLFEVSNVEKFSSKTNANFAFFSLDFELNQLILISILLSTLSIITRLISLRNLGKYSQMIGAFLANRVLTSILINTEDDSNLESQGSDYITSLTSIQIDYAVNSINAQFLFLINLFSAFILSIGLVYISPKISLSLILLLSAFFLISALIIRPKMKKNGEIISKSALFSNKESLNLYQMRDQLRINKNFSLDTLNFNLIYHKQRMGLFINGFISVIPRILIDFIIFLSVPIFLFLSVYLLKFNINLSFVIPTLVTLGVSMQRLLPTLNLLFRLWARIKGFNPGLLRTLSIIDNCSQIENYDFLKNSKNTLRNERVLVNKIKIKNLSFYSKQNKCLLSDCNYEIKKGDSICIMGDSGSGKTTFVRLISGLLKPSSGQILINNNTSIKKYYSYNHNSRLNLDISYLPQNGNLFSGTIFENLTLFSKKKADLDKLDKILKLTLCDEFVKKLPMGINEVINDRSIIKLSGGQIQRLAVARAIYQNSSMLLMDESTNALDKSKEETLLKNLIDYYKGILIVVTHRKNIAKLFTKNIIIKEHKLYEI